MRSAVGPIVIRTLTVAAVLALSLGGSAASDAQSTPPATPASFCGPITEVFVGDLPAGGYLVIDATKLTVGGVGTQVQLPPDPVQQLRVGVRVCFDGTVRRHPDRLEGVTGRVTIAPAGAATPTPAPSLRALPSTSTAP